MNSEGVTERVSTCSVRRSWVFGRYTTTYSCRLPSSQVLLSEVIHAAVQLLLPQLFTNQKETATTDQLLVDMKGRDAAEWLLPGLPPPHNDEVLRVGGLIAQDDQGEGFVWDPFDITCTAAFKGFGDAGDILYAGNVMRTPNVPTWLPLRLIGAAAPIRPTYLRFALEHFRPVRTFASLGMSPQVTETLLMDCNEVTLAMQVTIESKEPVSQSLLHSVPCLQASSGLINSLWGLNLIQDLLEKSQSH
jgi:hypothetical protein